MRATGIAAVVLSAALALGACGDDSDTSGDASDAPTTSVDAMLETTETTAADGGGVSGTAIVIKDFKFDPETLKAKVGDKITVTNNDSATHTLTARDNSFDTGNLDEGAKGTITLSKAGTVEYVCNIHDYMKGSIEVQ